jgi:hypothetical protein
VKEKKHLFSSGVPVVGLHMAPCCKAAKKYIYNSHSGETKYLQVKIEISAKPK